MTDWAIEPAPGQRPRRTEDDRITLALRISGGGRCVATAEMVLTMAEAEQLHAGLCRALDGSPPPPGAPDCRRDVQGGAVTVRVTGRA
ncbi:hypothetical protein [Streptomyces varsoviensis]|uniref:hypothetical protein n=1 Tax=Streptomyces varsoviensis TaxID=67373 RepID=UPI0004C605FA|nr:hypothetical protein [Streptomyces varsoviensis]